MEEERKPLENRNFIDAFIEEDLAPGGRFEGKRVHTRFPPEPNGYLHIGHCKALTIDFGTAEKFGGLCNLRMDDTNPTKEDTEYVDAIQQDIHWLGFDWGDRFFYGSDYFEKDYEFAVELIKKGLAYVCDLTPEEFTRVPRRYRQARRNAPYRDRSVEENLDLFDRMKAGRVPRGQPYAARKDRPGLRQLQYARPGHLPHPSYAPSPAGRQVVHLSHVRLCPPHPGRAGGHHATPCARWNLRPTAPCTTGW